MKLYGVQHIRMYVDKGHMEHVSMCTMTFICVTGNGI